MVPGNFEDFFSACAAVSGALIGLLFVAISVSPDILSGGPEHVAHQVKAGAAFSALVNTLLVSLFALIPGNQLGQTATILACVGLASTVGLTIFSLRDRDHDERIGSRQVILLAGAAVLYGLQLVNAVRLWRSPHMVDDVSSLAVILVVFFLVAIARAWDLIGARDTGFISGVAGLAHRSRPPDGGGG